MRDGTVIVDTHPITMRDQKENMAREKRFWNAKFTVPRHSPPKPMRTYTKGMDGKFRDSHGNLME